MVAPVNNSHVISAPKVRNIFSGVDLPDCIARYQKLVLVTIPEINKSLNEYENKINSLESKREALKKFNTPLQQIDESQLKKLKELYKKWSDILLEIQATLDGLPPELLSRLEDSLLTPTITQQSNNRPTLSS